MRGLSALSAAFGAGVVAPSTGAARPWGGPTTLCRLLSSTSAEQDSDTYDVIIVGSGIVGSALAALLGSNKLTRSLRVAILDQQVQSLEPNPAPIPELRVSTIIPASIACLQKAGAWPQLEPHAAMFSQMQVWDASGSGCIRWDARDMGQSHMGCVLENSTLQAALLAAAQRSAPDTTHMIWPASVTALGLPGTRPLASAPAAGPGPGAGSGGAAPGPSSGLAWLQLQDGRRLHARLVVAADGGNSRVRALAGLRTSDWDYQQRALVATVRTTAPEDRTAWQRFLPSGPFALLPVRGGYHNIVWSTTPQAARALEEMSPEDFAQAANKALSFTLDPDVAGPSSPPLGPGSSLSQLLGGALSQSQHLLGSLVPEHQRPQLPPQIQAWVGSRPRSFPLHLKQAGRYVLPKLALVGDAAHAVHPLAGQGVNLGLADAEALAQALAVACECGSDVGDPFILEEHYEKPQQAANRAMISALDAVKASFVLQAAPLAAVRNLGLSLINAVGPVRNGIMRYAMGL